MLNLRSHGSARVGAGVEARDSRGTPSHQLKRSLDTNSSTPLELAATPQLKKKRGRIPSKLVPLKGLRGTSESSSPAREEQSANYSLEELSELLRRDEFKSEHKGDLDQEEERSESPVAEEIESTEWEKQQMRTVQQCFVQEENRRGSFPMLLPENVWLYEVRALAGFQLSVMASKRGQGIPPSDPDPDYPRNNNYTVLHHSFFHTVIEIWEDNVGWIRFTQRVGAPVMYCFSSSKVVQGFYPHNETRAPKVPPSGPGGETDTVRAGAREAVEAQGHEHAEDAPGPPPPCSKSRALEIPAAMTPGTDRSIELGRWVVYEKMFGEQKCVVFKNKSVLFLLGNGFIFLGWGPRALSISHGDEIRFLHSRAVRTAAQEFSEDDFEKASYGGPRKVEDSQGKALAAVKPSEKTAKEQMKGV
ncbi:hypothetical protein GUITHDRAFT_111405 [Guillardia theta CCMP2712]|uniref:Uncharacterized protein n=1 Tax=Guillardia theta (strain CCMP2712) TaxID=905079 RepID=L1J2I0_GUITC|nr:hypothetical protein GUITHDRAFT_111405 [Guillardia theta CCMP2712]EKX42733.1 hypothetical protein GUITHDRAFT_111405 [Guillardia theta CCMP2712]|eukprot:XP_005829713.1 hypothetical protein GUITHDRAFT_111405 [Guillardia theta CCMP2712]